MRRQGLSEVQKNVLESKHMGIMCKRQEWSRMTIEDKKQQENLKNFDRNLKESTDQLAWFLYWMFAAVVLVLGMTLIFDGIFYRDAWMILCYVWMVVFMDNYVLAPYQWSNEAFSRRMQKSDAVSKILRFVPVSGKNYFRVRMQYLWKFVWKFGAFAMLIVIGSMSFTQKISLVRVMEGVLLFWAGPMLIGYIELKESLFCR